MLKSVYSFIVCSIALGSSVSFAASASSADIRSCVAQSKGDGVNMMAIARQCSGVQNVAVLRDCVAKVRGTDGFNMADTAAVCSGVSDVPKLRQCIRDERANGFNTAELAVLCNQR